MAFLDEQLQPAAKRRLEDHERKIRLGFIPGAKVYRLENCVALPVANETPRSSTSVVQEERPPLSLVPAATEVFVDNSVKDIAAARVVEVYARLQATLAELEQAKIEAGLMPAKRLRVPLKAFFVTAANYYDVEYEDVIGPYREAAMVRPRQVAMYLARELTGKSFLSIGRACGHRDHSTVLHGYNNIAMRRKVDRSLDRKINEIAALMRAQAGCV
jgi:hypothetical protein